jgi:hypothetical protein
MPSFWTSQAIRSIDPGMERPEERFADVLDAAGILQSSYRDPSIEWYGHTQLRYVGTG